MMGSSGACEWKTTVTYLRQIFIYFWPLTSHSLVTWRRYWLRPFMHSWKKKKQNMRTKPSNPVIHIIRCNVALNLLHDLTNSIYVDTVLLCDKFLASEYIFVRIILDHFSLANYIHSLTWQAEELSCSYKYWYTWMNYVMYYQTFISNIIAFFILTTK